MTKVWIFLILKYAVLVTAQQQSSVRMQTINDRMCAGRMDGIIFPDPDNCDSYVQCQGGEVTRRRCESGTLFDLNLYYCVSSHVVVCGTRRETFVPPARPNNPGQGNPPSAESHHSICRNRRNGDLIPNTNNCRAYIECQQNLRLDRECGRGELFDTRANVCLIGFMVDCGSRNIETSDVARSARNICLGLPTGTRMSHPDSCEKYYECQNNQQNEITCPWNQSFDMTLSQCRSSNLVNCGNRRNNRNQENTNVSRIPPPREGPQSPTPPSDFFPLCPNTGVTFRSHPHDCQAYFICAEGNLIQHECSTGIYFNPDTLKCDFAENVQCRLLRFPVPQTPMVHDCSGRKFLPHLVNCKQYFLCEENDAVLMNCPKGQVWNNQRQQCIRSSTEICP